ncbi:SRPBCC family protein [Polyangium aurulentum]|uniref:SRPBCC family protein n=1 Tax=Polyangium aurulentum TaxID=2567896 RepID=UPI0010AED38C|nr:SRPBCC family protein [Polyangium aurulentum]UQA56326.1 SRPBCC family protein [Polyangium aurulentum]
MPRIELTTLIAAPPERCFDLSRSVEAHLHSTSRSGERVVGGVMSGLLGLGDEVTWEARHLGVRQRLTSRMTQFDRPNHFRDSMVRGAFARFDHDHFFEATATGTLVRDVFDFDAPLGVLGRAAERVFLTAYMRRFLVERNEDLKRLAESEGWRGILPGG